METSKLTNLQKAIEIVDEVKALNEQVRKATPSLDVRASITYHSSGALCLNLFVYVNTELMESNFNYNFNEATTKDFKRFREHIMNDIYGKSDKDILRYYKMKQLEKLESELAENGE